MGRHQAGRVRHSAVATATVLALLVSGAVHSSSYAAAASPRLQNAQAKAAELRLAVDRLQVQAEQATEDYDAANAELAAVVTQHVLAQRQLSEAAAEAGDRSDAAGDRMRALYEAGGTAALYASLLDGNTIDDLASRYRSVSAIVDADLALSAAADGASLSAARIEGRLAALAQRQTTLEAQSAASAVRVRSLLAATEQLLATADVDVRRIAEEDRRAAEAAAAKAATARLAAARAAALLARQRGPDGAGLVLGAVAAPNPVAARAVAAAQTRVGLPYVWGATGPAAFDCSGLTGWAYGAAGVHLPRTSRQQWFAGRQVSLGELAPGDLLFWASNPADPATIHHVAMYVGDGAMVAAPHTGALVRVQPIYLQGYVGAVRPTAPAVPAPQPAPGAAPPS